MPRRRRAQLSSDETEDESESPAVVGTSRGKRVRTTGSSNARAMFDDEITELMRLAAAVKRARRSATRVRSTCYHCSILCRCLRSDVPERP